MKPLTLEEHLARILAVRAAADSCRACFRRERIGEYLAGQCIYFLGDYPARFSVAPTEYDYVTLQKLAESGCTLIQVHEEWNDAIRHFGADKFTAFDPEGMKKFVDLCHFFGIKVIPYTSTGYFHEQDPDFSEAFRMSRRFCTACHYNYAKCGPASAAWREYMLPRTFAMLDEYGFDGLYNDWGYDDTFARAMDALNGHPVPDNEAVPYDPEIEDLLSLIYTEVKSRGGVYKLHCDRNSRPPVKDRVYDYLWIGEGVGDAAVGVGKDFMPYVVPCQDKRRRTCSADRYFAMTVPFLQFPLLTWGRPLLGRGTHENIPYYHTDNPNGEYMFNRQVEEYMKDHPDGPYVYSLWSSIPDDPDDLPRWGRYCNLYREMVTPGSTAYIELRDCADILSPLPEKVYASMFVNSRRYLAVSNLTGGDYTLTLSQPWTDRETGEKHTSFTLADGKLLFLRLDEENGLLLPQGLSV